MWVFLITGNARGAKRSCRDWMDTSSLEGVGAPSESPQIGHHTFRQRTQLTLVADDASPAPELLAGAHPASSSPEDVIAPVRAGLDVGSCQSELLTGAPLKMHRAIVARALVY